MTEPKRHHYLPEFYLNGFCRDGLLCVFDRERREFRVQVPKDTAVRRYYYAVTDEDGNRKFEIEKLLSEIESAAKPVITKLDAGGALTDDDRDALSIFVGFLILRVPEFEERVHALYDGSVRAMNRVAFADEERAREVLEKRAKETGKPVSEDDVKALVALVESDEYDVLVHRNESLRQMLGHAEVMGRVFRQLVWLAVHPETERLSFVATDKPLCLLPPPGYKPNFYGYGIATQGSMKLVPLSQKTCLMLGDPGPEFKHAEAAQAHVRAINLNVTARCQQFVIGRDEDLVRNLVKTTRVDVTEAQPAMVVDGLGARKQRPQGRDAPRNE